MPVKKPMEGFSNFSPFLLFLSLPHDGTVELVDLLDVDVLPHEGAEPGGGVHAGGGDEHEALGGAVGVLDAGAGRGADGVRGLDVDAAVDVGQGGLGVGGQELGQLLGEDAGPHGGGDGGADGLAHGGHHALHGEHGGDVLVLGHGHDGHLLADDEGATTESDEDEAHDDVANVDVGLTELDHETDTEDGDGDTKEDGGPLEASVVAQEDTEKDGPEGATHGVDVAHVGGVGDAQVVDDDTEGVEVVVPHVPGSVDGGHHAVGEEDGAVLDEVPGDEGDGRKVLLPDDEAANQQTTEDEEADDQGRLPLLGLVRVQGEGEEEQTNTGSGQDNTNDVKLLAVEDNVLDDATSVGLDVDKSSLDGLALVPVEESSQGRADDGDDNGEDTVSPSPAGTGQEAVAGVSVDPGGDEPRGRDVCDGEGSVSQLRGIGDENGNGEVQPRVSSVVEDGSGAVGLNIVASSKHDETNGHKTDGEQQSLGTSKVVHVLGIGKLGEARDKTGDNAGGRDQRVRRVTTDGVGSQSTGDTRGKGVDEVDQPHPGKGWSVSYTGP